MPLKEIMAIDFTNRVKNKLYKNIIYFKLIQIFK